MTNSSSHSLTQANSSAIHTTTQMKTPYYFALLDDARHNRATLYHHYHHSQHLDATNLQQLDTLLQQGWAASRHALLFIEYEFGFPLVQLPNRGGKLHLHWFNHKTTISQTSKWLNLHTPNIPSGISTPINQTTDDSYLHTIDAIKAAIARGDTYQINYTTRLTMQAYGNPIRLYQRLRQPVPYGVLAHLPNENSSPNWTLSFSPERFLHIDKKGQVSSKPMKGTAPTTQNPIQNHHIAKQLQHDAKNRAENTMIVDLLRNDLSKIAEKNTVCVPKAFTVREYGSVWQMTSTITAQLKPQTTIADLLQATFPCGSITGAPKRMSMQLIDQYETTPRGIYTGSIGQMPRCGGR